MTAATNGIKGFSISLLLHLVAAAFFLNLSQNKSVAQEELEKPLILSLKSFELPEASQPQKNEIPKESVQKQEIQKTVKKSVEKTTIRNRAVQSAEPVKEALKPTQEAFTEENIETVVPTQSDTIGTEKHKLVKSEESIQSEFIKTNFQSIRDMVLTNLKYPNSAKRMGIEGCVEVTLIIDSSGKLLDIVLEKSSGHEVLDKSAMQAAGELYAQSLPVPQMISRVTLPIQFALN